MSPATDDIERVADAVLACSAPLTLILDQMTRAPEPLPPRQAAAVLRALLRTTLEPLTVRATSDELRAAARLIDAAADLIAEEFLLAPHPPPRRRPRRRTRGDG